MKLTQIENDILKELIQSISSEKKMTIEEIAVHCHVSKSLIVKLSKKLGYSGYTEMFYRMQNKKSSSLQINSISEIPDAKMSLYIEALTELISHYSDCKNLVVASKRNKCVSNYIVKKLCFFDVFVTSSYDVDMMETPTGKRGLILFIVEKEDIDYMMNIITLAKDRGFNIVILSNNFTVNYDLAHLNINFLHHNKLDLFRTDILIIFENIFENYSKIISGSNENE